MKQLLSLFSAILITIVTTSGALAVVPGSVRLSGRVTDAGTGEPMEFVNIVATPGRVLAVTDADGHWQMNLAPGRYRLVFSFVGYQTDTVAVSVPRADPIRVRLRESVSMLGEVVITAKESSGVTSSSRIDRDAMSHLQPTSFTDLLELLPGNISQNPDMGKVNSINLRETGGVSATGARTDLSEDYAMTSLGTAFMVDGAPVSGDANLQSVPASGDMGAQRNSTNRGVDMRTISTDNIESVEIVRGIPSAEYGNLTSGVVNIKRIRRATPFTARFKADEYSKLFSAGKGLGLGRNVLNADFSYLDSKIDPRDSRENYRRITGSLRGHLLFGSADSRMTADWTVGADYTGSFDNAKVDPDLNYNKIDEFKSEYNRWALTSDLKFSFPRLRWIDGVSLNTAVAMQHDRLTRRKQVAPARA